jgi:hypothetical protein
MDVRNNARLGLKGVLAAILCALLALAFLNAGVARAADTQTHSIAGLNYTLPADWQQLATLDDLEGLDQVEGLDLDYDSLGDLAVWGLGDGVFVAFSVEEPSVADTAVEELEAAAAYAELSLAGTPLEGLSFVAATDQGCPALVGYSDDITFNAETYALTVEVFAVDDPGFTGAVVMASFLPASGTVNEDLSSLVDVLQEDAAVSVGDFTYTVPAGSSLVQGSVLAMEYAAALDEDGETGGLMFALDVPFDLGVALTADDLQELADGLNDGLGDALDEVFGGETEVSDLWCGAYTWLGLPTIGLEGSFEGVVYFGLMVSVADDGATLLVVAEPDGSPYVDDLLASASTTAVPAASDEAASAADDEPASDDPGFVVGFSASDGAR